MEPARPNENHQSQTWSYDSSLDTNLVVSGEVVKLTLGKVRAEKVRVLTERSVSLVCRRGQPIDSPGGAGGGLLDALLGQRSGKEGTDSLTFYWRGETLRMHVEVSVFHYLRQRSLISGSEPVGDRDRRVPKIRFCEGDIRNDQ